MMKHLVLIPFFNEEPTIAAVLRELRQHYAGPILAVDDGSTDGSVAAARASGVTGLELTHHDRNRGYGASLMEGFRYASEKDFDYVVTMDCDCQHEPRQVPEFLRECQGTDVLSGSRYLSALTTDEDAPADRMRINRLITERINSITSFGITDAFCGFKAYRTAIFRNMALDETGYAFPLQFWIQAYARKLSVREIPVRRIYPNAERSFGALLDDPQARLRYYEAVIDRELERWKLTPS